MTKAISVKFLPGDKVRIGDIRGHVSCVSVYWQTRVRYEVTYWRDGSKCEVWCDEFEVEAA